MKKTMILLLFVLCILLSSGYTQFTTADDDREWHSVENLWFTGGNLSGTFYNFSFSNSSVIPISPPLEGDGIYRLNYNTIEANISNYVIFSIGFLSAPKTGRIWPLGEYFIKDEMIVAIYFTLVSESENVNYSDIRFTFYNPEGKIVISKNLDIERNITILEEPVILNSSGLYKTRIDFLSLENTEDENFWVFEDISRWIAEGDDKKYLTFSLGAESNLSFQNYYEKFSPVFTLEDIIGIQQMLLAEQQGEYLKETADSIKKIAEDQTIKQIISIIGVGTVTIIGGLSLMIIKDKIILKRKLFKGLLCEITSNRIVLDEIFDSHKYDPAGHVFPFKRDSYINILNSGKLLELSDKLRNTITDAYFLMENFTHYADMSDTLTFSEHMIKKLDKIIKELQKELTFLKDK